MLHISMQTYATHKYNIGKELIPLNNDPMSNLKPIFSIHRGGKPHILRILTGECWSNEVFQQHRFNAADQQRDAGEPSLLAGMAREVIREFSADPTRVYAAGL